MTDLEFKNHVAALSNEERAKEAFEELACFLGYDNGEFWNMCKWLDKDGCNLKV